MKADFFSLLTPPAIAHVIREVMPAPVSNLTQALNVFDACAPSLSVRDALKFRRSLKLPDTAEMFLHYSDAERQEQIHEV